MHDHEHILVVEDDTDIREGVISVLADEGYAAIGASNGKQGLEELAKNRPRLILLDLMMPVMGGAEFLARLRAQSDPEPIPVVVLSAWPKEAAAIREAQGFIDKPIDLERLLSTVEQFCGRSAR